MERRVVASARIRGKGDRADPAFPSQSTEQQGLLLEQMMRALNTALDAVDGSDFADLLAKLDQPSTA